MKNFSRLGLVMLKLKKKKNSNDILFGTTKQKKKKKLKSGTSQGVSVRFINSYSLHILFPVKEWLISVRILNYHYLSSFRAC